MNFRKTATLLEASAKRCARNAKLEFVSPFMFKKGPVVMVQKKRFWLLFYVFFLSAFAFAYPAFAEIKVFQKEVEAVVGQDQSREQAEASALQKAKDELNRAEAERIAKEREMQDRIDRTLAEQEKAKRDEAAARLLARKQIGKDGRFIAYNDGTVLDRGSGLMWAAKDNGSDINWQDAKSYCENYREGGYTDWRMPTQDELMGLYDKAQGYKSACGDEAHLTELIRLTCYFTWASDTRDSGAACFRFGGGGYRCWGPPSGSGSSRALPVRSAGSLVAESAVAPDARKKATSSKANVKKAVKKKAAKKAKKP